MKIASATAAAALSVFVSMMCAENEAVVVDKIELRRRACIQMPCVRSRVELFHIVQVAIVSHVELKRLGAFVPATV